MHMTSNILVEIHEGRQMATLTAHAMAYHMRTEDASEEEDTSYKAANLYDIKVASVGAENEWKIKEWDVKVLWRTGDRAFLHE
jgi:hypothetical protein